MMGQLTRPAARLVLIALGVAAAALVLLRLGDSLWLDETGTFWVVKDGLRETIDRAHRYQGQSPLYYLLVWAALQAGGLHEWVLRLPSVAAMAGTIAVTHRLGKRLFDTETGLTAALFLLVTVGSEAANARPYALALFLVVASTALLVRFLDRGALGDGVAYAVLAALVVYAHYLFGTILLVHALAALELRGRGAGGRGASQGRVLAAFALVGLLLVPLAPQFLALLGRRQSLAFAPRPSLEDVLGALVPVALVPGAALGLLLGRKEAGLALRRPPGESAHALLVLYWHLVPILAVFLVSSLTKTSIFVPRYYLAAAPGLALLVALAVRAVEPPRLRLLVTVAIAVFSFQLAFVGSRKGDDWREAARAVQENVLPAEVAGSSSSTTGTTVPTTTVPATTVFLATGFIEGDQLDWLADPEKASYLLAPTAFYRFPGEVVLLPFSLSKESERYVEEAVARRAGTARRILLVASRRNAIGPWLEGRLGPEKLACRTADTSGTLEVRVFERR